MSGSLQDATFAEKIYGGRPSDQELCVENVYTLLASAACFDGRDVQTPVMGRLLRFMKVASRLRKKIFC
jgi:hypothetical protein